MVQFWKQELPIVVILSKLIEVKFGQLPKQFAPSVDKELFNVTVVKLMSLLKALSPIVVTLSKLTEVKLEQLWKQLAPNVMALSRLIEVKLLQY